MEYEITTITIKTAIPKGAPIIQSFFNIPSIVNALQTAYGNAMYNIKTEKAPDNPCTKHLYWDADTCPHCKRIKCKRYHYRKEYIKGMSLEPASLNVWHNGEHCHVKYVPIKRLKIRNTNAIIHTR